MNIKRSLAVAAIGVSAGACAAPRPVPALSLSNPDIANHSGERDWFGIAIGIRNASQFKAWEPVIEEITGAAAVPSKRVRLLSKKETEAVCGRASRGCYSEFGEEIIISTAVPPGEPKLASYSEDMLGSGCRGLPSTDLWGYPRFALYIHEQGHHFDLNLGSDPLSRYIAQVEATAFEYYFAEHVAVHYDRHLGLNLIVNNLTNAGIPASAGLHDSETAKSNELRLIGGFTRLSSNPETADDSHFVHLGVYSLLASGLDSFGGVWRFVHTHSHEEVALRIGRNAHLAAKGGLIAEKRVFSLSGMDAREDADVSFEIQPDFSGMQSLKMSRPPQSPILEINFANQQATFALLAIGHPYLNFHDNESGLNISAVSRMHGIPRFSIGVKDRGGPVLSIGDSLAGPPAAVHLNYAMANPSYCHSYEKDVTSESGTYALRVRAQFERIVRGLEESGKYPEEAKLARSVLDGVFGQMEPAQAQAQHVFNP